MWRISVKVSVSGLHWLREQEAPPGERMSLEMHGSKLSANLFPIFSGHKANLCEPVPPQRGQKANRLARKTLESISQGSLVSPAPVSKSRALEEHRLGGSCMSQRDALDKWISSSLASSRSVCLQKCFQCSGSGRKAYKHESLKIRESPKTYIRR